jgi:hypothetical protein
MLYQKIKSLVCAVVLSFSGSGFLFAVSATATHPHQNEFEVVVSSSRTVDLIWNHDEDNAVLEIEYQGAVEDAWGATQVLKIEDKTVRGIFPIEELESATLYRFRVKTGKGSGQSIWTEWVEVITAASDPYIAPEGYTLSWIDTFDHKFSTRNWTKGLVNEVQPDNYIIWHPETGGPGLLNDGYAGYIIDEDVYIKDGNLFLQNQKHPEGYVGTDPAGTFTYTSGWVNSKSKRLVNGTQKGVYVEMKAKFPAGGNVWPAIWMVAEAFRWPPEIDIWEYFGTFWNPNWGADIMKMNYFARDETKAFGVKKIYDGKLKKFAEKYAQPDEWHVYGFLWDAEKMLFIIDGEIVHGKYRGNVPDVEWSTQLVEHDHWLDEDMVFVLNNGVQTGNLESKDPNTGEQNRLAFEDEHSYWPNSVILEYFVVYEEDK